MTTARRSRGQALKAVGMLRLELKREQIEQVTGWNLAQCSGCRFVVHLVASSISVVWTNRSGLARVIGTLTRAQLAALVARAARDSGELRVGNGTTAGNEFVRKSGG